MIEITSAQVTPGLSELFDSGMLNAHRCFGVLAGNVIGRILTDSPSGPTWGVVREAGVGLAFIGGSIKSEELRLAIAELRKSGDVGLSHWTGEKPGYALPPNPDAEGTDIALEFTARSDGATSLEALLQGMPPECTLRRMDSQLIERCLWRDDPIRVSGSLERFLEKGVGYCLMRGDEILSEAYATYYALDTRDGDGHE